MLNTQDLTAFITEMGTDRPHALSTAPLKKLLGFRAFPNAGRDRGRAATCATL